MSAVSLNKRFFHAFLSHAHADKEVVDRLHDWLTDAAGIPVWYDSQHLPPSSQIATYLPEAIVQCRSMIIVLSARSIQSGWVGEEHSAAVMQRTQVKDYRIIPIRIEACEVPGFLQTTKWIDMLDRSLTPSAANSLLSALYGPDLRSELGKTRDIYVSRSWRESEAALPDYVCRLLDRAGYRLIGDSMDQAGFLGGIRVNSIMSSCGGFVSIVPHREPEGTSPYILREIELARDLKLPNLIIADPAVQLPQDLNVRTIRLSASDVANAQDCPPNLGDALEALNEAWRPPERPHYVFFSTDFDPAYVQRNRMLKQSIERVTAMPCIMGDDIREGHIQHTITERIANAFVMIADISEGNLNTCIEAGIARGAKTRCHLIARNPRGKPPFMFRDQQVWFYGDETELLGVAHRIIYSYRRRVLNQDLPR